MQEKLTITIQEKGNCSLLHLWNCQKLFCLLDVSMFLASQCGYSVFISSRCKKLQGFTLLSCRKLTVKGHQEKRTFTPQPFIKNLKYKLKQSWTEQQQHPPINVVLILRIICLRMSCSWEGLKEGCNILNTLASWDCWSLVPKRQKKFL